MVGLRPRLISIGAALALLVGSSTAGPDVSTTVAARAQLRTVRLGPGAGPVLVDSASGHIFVADSLAGVVEMRSAATGALLSDIQVCPASRCAIASGPGFYGSIAMLLSSTEHRLFVTARDLVDRKSVALFVDTHNGTVLARREAFGAGGIRLLLEDDETHRLLISQDTDPGKAVERDDILLLDAGSGRVVASTPLGGLVMNWELDAVRHHALVVYEDQHAFQNGDAAHAQHYGMIDTLTGRFVPIADINQNGNLPVLDIQRGIAMILDTDESKVHVVDLTTGKVLHVLPVDAFPESGVIDPNTGRAYIVSLGPTMGQSPHSTLSAIDPRRGRVLYVAVVGANVTGISLDPSGTRAYVTADTASGDLSIVATATGKLMGTANVGETSMSLPALVVRNIAYVISYGDYSVPSTAEPSSKDKLLELNPSNGRLLRTVVLSPETSWPPLQDLAHQLLVTASTGRILQSWPVGAGTLSVIDAANGTLLQRVSVGMEPQVVAQDPSTGSIIVLNSYGDGTAPGPALGDKTPVCDAKIAQQNWGPVLHPCRLPYASLSIVTPHK